VRTQDDVQDTQSGAVSVTKPAQAGSNCEDACKNYVGKCLTLVPGASETLFKQGSDSCMEECVQWTSAKTDCIASAASCESMTDACGL